MSYVFLAGKMTHTESIPIPLITNMDTILLSIFGDRPRNQIACGKDEKTSFLGWHR